MGDLTSGSAAAVETVTETVYHISQADVDGLFTLVTGLVTLQWFSLLAQLILLGAVLVVVFVIALRRF